MISILEGESPESIVGGVEGSNRRKIGERSWGTVFERLKTTKQIRSVDEFIKEFEILVALTLKVPEEILLGYFVGRF